MDISLTMNHMLWEDRASETPWGQRFNSFLHLEIKLRLLNKNQIWLFEYYNNIKEWMNIMNIMNHDEYHEYVKFKEKLSKDPLDPRCVINKLYLLSKWVESLRVH